MSKVTYMIPTVDLEKVSRESIDVLKGVKPGMDSFITFYNAQGVEIGKKKRERCTRISRQEGTDFSKLQAFAATHPAVSYCVYVMDETITAAYVPENERWTVVERTRSESK